MIATLPDLLLRWTMETYSYHGSRITAVASVWSSTRTVELPEYLNDTEGHNNDVVHVKVSDYQVVPDITEIDLLGRAKESHEQVLVKPGELLLLGDRVSTDTKFSYSWFRVAIGVDENGMPWIARCDSAARCDNIKAKNPTTWRKVQIFLKRATRVQGTTVYSQGYRETFVTKAYPGTDSSDPFEGWSAIRPQGSEGYIRGRQVVSNADEVAEKLLRVRPISSCMYREPMWIFDNALKPDRVEELQDGAFTTAFDQFPAFTDNAVANIAEMYDAVTSFMSGAAGVNLLEKLVKWKKAYYKNGLLTQAVKELGSLWLAYRYAYCTTTSDLRQAMDFMGRNAISYMKPQRFDGNYTFDDVANDITVDVHCCFDVVLDASNMLGCLAHYGEVAGTRITPYRLWDLVPLSFVADWFVDIGGWLRDKEQLQAHNYYKFSNICWSVSYYKHWESVTHHAYSRWYEEHIPDRIVRRVNSSSRNCALKRAADGTAITVGRIH